jgi:hypothetical protein
MKKVNKNSVFHLSLLIVFLLSGVSCLFASTPPSLELLTPRIGDEISFEAETVVAISIFDEDGDIDIGSMILKVDGREVTAEANRSIFLVTYSIEKITRPGEHTVEFTVSDRDGNSSEISGFFFVMEKPEKEKFYTLDGYIKTGLEYDELEDPEVVGRGELNVYGTAFNNAVDYGLLVDLTNEEASNLQRLSIFRMDVYSPIGGMVLGDTTPYFSDFTVNGLEVFGVHLLPQFNWFGMELVYGRSFDNIDETEAPTYKQRVWGGRLKLGRPGGFLWGLSLVKVKDDEDSLDIPTGQEDEFPKPQDNVVVGTDFTFSLFQGNVRFRVEANESLLNTDISGGTAGVDEFDLGFDPDNWEWLITINEHIVPLNPGLPNLAAAAELTVGPLRDNTFTVEYIYIGPSFFSLGNTIIINDRTGVNARDSLWLFNRKFLLNTSFQYYTDNLRDTLDTTTKTVGGSGYLYGYPVSNISFNLGTDLLSVDDNDQVDTFNTTITAGANYDFGFWITESTAFLNTSTTLFNDNNPADPLDANDYSVRGGLASYFSTIPLDTKVVLGYEFGDTFDSVYAEGMGGYRFLKDESLYVYADLIYESGNKLYDLILGAAFDTIFDTLFEAEFEYITSETSSEALFSAFATKEF